MKINTKIFNKTQHKQYFEITDKKRIWMQADKRDVICMLARLQEVGLWTQILGKMAC